ncbi:MAG: ATP-binding protein, partial [Verrucomicrobiales bacterium]
MLDHLPVAIFVKDVINDFRFVVWNKKQESITGIPSLKALGRNDFELFSHQSASYFREIDKAIVNKGEVLEIPEEVLDLATAGHIYLHTVKLPVPTTRGTFLVGISEDITEQVEGRTRLEMLNHDLFEKKEELEEVQQQLFQAAKLESIGRLAAGVAHEVKNPLNLILQGIEYLGGGVDPSDPNVGLIVRELREAVFRASRIVHGLVDFSANRRLSCEPADPVDLIEKVLLMIRHEIMCAKISVNRCLESDLPKILVDHGKVEQVLLNILLNAIHAMKGISEPELTITVRAEKAAAAASGDEVVLIEIKDNGTGIKQTDMDSIFDPFFTTKPAGSGTGLGLSIARKIIKLHHGEISINNNHAGPGANV